MTTTTSPGVDVPDANPEGEGATPAPVPSAWRERIATLRSRFSRRQLIALGSAAGTVIGVVAIVVPLAVAGSTRASDTDSLEVSSQGASTEGAGLEAVERGVATAALGLEVGDAFENGFDMYAVPVDAPWEELWAAQDPLDGCTTQAQRAWLDSHGTIIPPNLLTSSLTNTASTGSEITVSEIRAQGELTVPTKDTVTVAYYTCSGGGDDGVFAHIDLGVDPVALYDDCYADGSCYFSGDTPPVAGDPVVFTVRPGETRTLNLSYDQAVDFVGRFVATVTVDGESSTIDLTPGADDIVAPVVTRPDLYLRIASAPADTLCAAVDVKTAQRGGLGECSLDAWLALLNGAGGD